MAVTAVVGANWGDEGKGKITDYLGAKADFVVRYQGGDNAGHTIINEFGKFALNLLPSGVCHTSIINVIGPGVAFNPLSFVAELQKFLDRGMTMPQLRISDRAQMVLPVHVMLDVLEEQRLADRQFGSTKSGIAPFYADKYQKIGIQVADLFDDQRLYERLQALLEMRNTVIVHLYGKDPVRVEDIMATLQEKRAVIAPFVCDTTALLHDAIRQGKHILVEGQLGALRDPDHGIFPYSTSSSTLAGYATVGAGIPVRALTEVIAVVKAYSSCVGAGPFVSELFDEQGDTLRRLGGDAGEYGAKTGRPRRVGWFDAVATRYGCQVQGATQVALTNLDVLGYLDEVPVCYAYEIDGNVVHQFPTTAHLDRAQPVIKHLPGWKTDISSIRTFEQLPKAAQDYVHFVEEVVGCPITIVSVGPKREDIILRG